MFNSTLGEILFSKCLYNCRIDRHINYSHSHSRSHSMRAMYVCVQFCRKLQNNWNSEFAECDCQSVMHRHIHTIITIGWFDCMKFNGGSEIEMQFAGNVKCHHHFFLFGMVTACGSLKNREFRRNCVRYAQSIKSK